MKNHSGYLIVLATKEPLNISKNSLYCGIDRVPVYCFQDQEPIKEEIDAMENYIFGEARNELGLIETYETAVRLLAQFQSSPRKFELIWCCALSYANKTESPISLDKPTKIFIGFDVAALGGDYWSIVGDFPNNVEFENQFNRLNNFGLLSSAEDAENYLIKYKALKLPDCDSPFQIVGVYKLETVTANPLHS